MTTLQDVAVSLSFQWKASLPSPLLGTRCSTNYSDGDINESPRVYFQHTNQRLASICRIWSLIKMWLMNSKSELEYNKGAPEKKWGPTDGKTILVNSFSVSNFVKDKVTGSRKCREYQEKVKGIFLITYGHIQSWFLTKKPQDHLQVKSNFYLK